MDLSVSDAPVGRLIDGRYRIESLLAQGGMATVYQALDTRLDRIVALKVMHPELAADDEFVERFIREAHAAARLSDPHVVAVFDQGEDAGAVFLAMEFVEGQTLREALREHGRLEPGVALEVTESVLSALSSAHKAGIVHRDVKPENVLISNEGRVKVADFGLARATTSPTNDTGGVLLGTVNYISPEQALGEPATARSDVYSAGIVLYEMLTGTVPHSGPTDFVVVRSHIDEDVPPPSQLTPVHADIDQLVRTATARDPGGRFADATRFLSATRRARLSLDGFDQPGAYQLAEPRESAGVGVDEALESTSSWQPDWADDDRPPPPPPRDNANHTRVINGAPMAESPMRRADRRDRLEQEQTEHGRQRPSWKKTTLFLTVLVIAIAVAVGAWWMGLGRYTDAPALVNLTATQAQERAERNGLEVNEERQAHSETVEPGKIISTDPKTGERILDGGTINYTISKGPERYEVPNLVNMTAEQAKAALKDLNLKADVKEVFHESAEKGIVVEQSVAAGNQVKPDTQVSISVSQGREPLEIRDYSGEKIDNARAELAAMGLQVEEVPQAHPTVQPGFIISQNPAGTVYKGDVITLEVSQGAIVPNVVGQALRDAEAILKKAGYNVEAVSLAPGGKVHPNAKVMFQDPPPDTPAPGGSKVTLRVL